jgi:hypothetical protein
MLSFAGRLSAQTADAIIDQPTIRIGEQATLLLSVPFEKGRMPNVVWPTIGDTLVPYVEVLSKTTIDTLATGAEVRTSRLEQRLTITSFDSGYYAIPPFRFVIDGQTVQTQAFLFTVKSVEIDTTAGIRDIRDIYQVEITWMDYLLAYWPFAAGALGAIAAATLAYVIVSRLRKKRASTAQVSPVIATKPAHLRAIEKLEQLRVNRHYAVGKVKLHHTIIADALRDYMEEVCKIPAHEYTSRQILNSLRYSGIPATALQSLGTILTTADMVKFAKERPDDVENEIAVTRAIEFIQSTWQLLQKSDKPAQPQA